MEKVTWKSNKTFFLNSFPHWQKKANTNTIRWIEKHQWFIFYDFYAFPERRGRVRNWLQREEEMMQSSLPVPYGRTGFNFASNSKPRTTHSTFPKSPHLFFSNPSSSSSSSYKLRFTSQFQNPPRNEPIFTTPTKPIPTRSNRISFVTPLHCSFSSNSCSENVGRDFRSWIGVVGEALSTAFPIWVALGCLLGLIRPSSFNWVQPKWTVLGISVTMLGMGMTLTFDDLRGALAMPKELLVGFMLQYSVCSNPI